MTQNLPSQEVDLFRCLKKTAIVLMLMFRLDRPAGERELADILDIHRESVRAYLGSLARLGLVTRTHRFHGWILTVGGRQMILGESAAANASELGPGEQGTIMKTRAEKPSSLHAVAAVAGARAENPSSLAEISSSMVENPPSLPFDAVGVGAGAEDPPSMAEKSSSLAKIPSSMAKNPPSPPLAAAILSLNSLSLKELAAAAKAGASGKNCRSSAKFSRSRIRPRMRKIKKQDRTANGGVRSDSLFQANLEAFVSIGLVQNDFISGICRMDHVTPGYILGQKKRLEAERRYSAGLLLKVIQCKDSLPNKYITCDSSPPSSNGAGASVPPLSRGAGGDSPEIEPDPSIHEPLSPSGMTAARAWSAVLRELQMDMPKAAYDKWVRRAVLLSARDGTFVIGAYNGFARDWLESRLTRTITRLLAGSCNRAMEVKFADRQGVRPCRSAKQEI